jgi:hypothetical protein
MKREMWAGWAIVPVLLVCFLVASTALAQSGGGYDLTWSTVDGGGGESSGGGYTLAGTAGQPDANTLTGGGYTLKEGFWAGGVLVETYWVYLPIMLRQY